jgi:ABC-type multidrug transport system ATPase subunit
VQNNNAIHVSNLAVSVNQGRKTLLSGINFSVSSGQFIAVIGASGCGKSTLIKTLAGLMLPSHGRVLFAGHPVAEIKEQFPLAVGYLPQFGAFHADLTVEENLLNAVSLRLPRSVSAGVKQQWMRHIIELARLESFLHQSYKTLSGGQMRRMALAEELIGDPAFLLLDELTSGLDEFSDREMMQWLRDLAHEHGKTIVLVTHATYHLDCCDSVLFLHNGRQAHYAPYAELLASHSVSSISDLFEIYQTGDVSFPPVEEVPETAVTTQGLKTAQPPNGFLQFATLLKRQAQLFFRDRTQIGLHLALILTFPALVAVFAYKGLPQVRQLTLAVESNIVKTLAEQLMFLKESFHASSLVSGLAMFQVILLTLMGANNGAREIAKEGDLAAKELRAGLSPLAYVGTKFLQLAFLCAVQAFWMAWFVKAICGFPGALTAQFAILFATTLAMSATCLAISSSSSTPERASLLAIYLVGFQLPLSGAALPLPDWLSLACRPFIAAYWGWSGYLKTLESTRHYDIVRQATATYIAPYGSCLMVLALHVLVALFLAWYFVGKRRTA